MSVLPNRGAFWIDTKEHQGHLGIWGFLVFRLFSSALGTNVRGRDRQCLIKSRILVDEEILVHLFKPIIGLVNYDILCGFSVWAISTKQRQLSFQDLHSVGCFAYWAELYADIIVVRCFHHLTRFFHSLGFPWNKSMKRNFFMSLPPLSCKCCKI